MSYELVITHRYEIVSKSIVSFVVAEKRQFTLGVRSGLYGLQFENGQLSPGKIFLPFATLVITELVNVGSPNFYPAQLVISLEEFAIGRIRISWEHLQPVQTSQCRLWLLDEFCRSSNCVALQYSPSVWHGFTRCPIYSTKYNRVEFFDHVTTQLHGDLDNSTFETYLNGLYLSNQDGHLQNNTVYINRPLSSNDIVSVSQIRQCTSK